MTQTKLTHLLIIGAQKAGTTSLFDYLARHPHIAVSNEKEVNFFTFRYERGLSWYRESFVNEAGARYMLDASPQYLHHDEAPQRIVSEIPDATLICILRDPIDRAISNYRYNVSRGLQNPSESFDDAVRTARGEEIYLKKGLYAQQLSQFTDFFVAGRIHILDFANLISKPKYTTHTLCHSLGLDPALLPKDVGRISNKTVDTRGLGAQLIYRAMLLRTRFDKTYASMPRWAQIRMSSLKAFIASLSKVSETKFELSPNTHSFLLDYFAGDIRDLSEKFGFCPEWAHRFYALEQASPEKAN